MAEAKGTASPMSWHARWDRLRTAPHRVFEEDVCASPLRKRVWAGAVITAQEIAASDLASRASAMAFSFVLSIVPLLTTTLAFFTAIPGLAEERERVQGWLVGQLVPSAVDAVRNALDQFSDRAAAAGTISSLFFVAMVLIVFQTMEQGVNRIFRVECERPWGARARALATFFMGGAIAAAALVAVEQETRAIGESASGVLGAALVAFALHVGGLVVACLVVAFAIAVVPNARVSARAALVGGLVGGSLWFVLKSAFGWYVTHVAGYQNVYGTLGAVPAFLLWIYLSMLLLLLGAQVAFVVQHFAALAERRRVKAGHEARAFYAIAVATALARAFREGEGPLSTLAITARLDVPSYFVTEAVRALSASGLLVMVPSSGGEPRYLLGRPSHDLTVQEVVARVTQESLDVPEQGRAASAPWAVRIGALFEQARSRESNVLACVTLADLEDAERHGARPRSGGGG